MADRPEDAAVRGVEGAHRGSVFEVPGAEALPSEIRVGGEWISEVSSKLRVQDSEFLPVVRSFPAEAMPEDECFARCCPEWNAIVEEDHVRAKTTNAGQLLQGS